MECGKYVFVSVLWMLYLCACVCFLAWINTISNQKWERRWLKRKGKREAESKRCWTLQETNFTSEKKPKALIDLKSQNNPLTCYVRHQFKALNAKMNDQKKKKKKMRKQVGLISVSCSHNHHEKDSLTKFFLSLKFLPPGLHNQYQKV